MVRLRFRTAHQNSPLASPRQGRDNLCVSRTFRISRRTFKPVPDSRTPRSSGARGYQLFADGSFRLGHPLDRYGMKRTASKMRRRGDRMMVEWELACG